MPVFEQHPDVDRGVRAEYHALASTRMLTSLIGHVRGWLFMRVGPMDELPGWYGVSYRDYQSNQDICSPLGLNIIFAVLYAVLQWVQGPYCIVDNATLRRQTRHDRQTIQKQKANVEKLESYIEELEDAVHRRDDILKNTSKGLDRIEAKANAIADEHEERISYFKNQIRNRDITLADQRRILNEQHGTINALNAKLGQASAEIVDREATIRHLERDLHGYSMALNARESQLKDHEEDIISGDEYRRDHQEAIRLIEWYKRHMDLTTRRLTEAQQDLAERTAEVEALEQIEKSQARIIDRTTADNRELRTALASAEEKCDG